MTTQPLKKKAAPEPPEPQRSAAVPPEIAEESHDALAQCGVRYPPRSPGSIPGDGLRRVAAYAGGARRAATQQPKNRAPPAFAPWSLQELIDELSDELH